MIETAVVFLICVALTLLSLVYLYKRLNEVKKEQDKRIDDVIDLIANLSTEIARLGDAVENEMNEETENSVRRKIEEVSNKVMDEWTDAIVNYSPWSNRGGKGM